MKKEDFSDRGPFSMPNWKIAQARQKYVVRRSVIVIEIKKGGHGGDFLALGGRIHVPTPGEVPAHRLEKLAGPFPTEQVAKPSDHIPRNSFVRIVMNGLAVFIDGIHSAAPTAFRIEQRYQFVLLFLHHGGAIAYKEVSMLGPVTDSHDKAPIGAAQYGSNVAHRLPERFSIARL